MAVIWELSRNFSGVSFFSTTASPMGLFSFLTVDSCVTRVSIPRDYCRNCKSLVNLDSRTLEQQFSTWVRYPAQLIFTLLIITEATDCYKINHNWGHHNKKNRVKELAGLAGLEG